MKRDSLVARLRDIAGAKQLNENDRRVIHAAIAELEDGAHQGRNSEELVHAITRIAWWVLLTAGE